MQQGSSELTKYIFDDLAYEKPFFSTYVKTSLFSTYLLGFFIYPPWREECRRQLGRLAANGNYQRVQVNDLDEDTDEIPEDIESHDDQVSDDSSQGRLVRSLSSPAFVPANIPESGKSSGTEESDIDGGPNAANRRVRFKRMAEVRKSFRLMKPFLKMLF